MDFSICNAAADAKKPWSFAGGWAPMKMGIKEAILRFVWSPIVWKDGYRKSDNFSHADYCVLDFDDGLRLTDAIERTFCDMNFLIGTTKSHGIEKQGLIADRYRVIIPFTRRITDLNEFCSTMRHYVKFFDSDNTCIDAARFYFPCKTIASVQILDAEGCLEPIECGNVQKVEFKYYGKKLPKWIDELLKSDNPIELSLNGSINSIIFRVAAGLATCGITDPEQQFKMIKQSKITEPFICPRTKNKKKGTNDNELIRVIKNGIERGKKEMSA